MDPLTQIASWLREARSAVAFTGAGISTESGIPDFRSPGGLWSRHKPVHYTEFVASREARIRYWQMRVALCREFAGAAPNAGHLALARLEQQGRLAALITQNIDGLHQRAGSRKVIELHGTAHVVACIACGQESTPDETHARIDAGDPAPDCLACGAPLKSRTISFGQAMPEREMEASVRLCEGADVFLAIGSSLVVQPAAGLPELARAAGARLVIINQTPTPQDNRADVVLRDAIGSILPRIVDLIGTLRPRPLFIHRI